MAKALTTMLASPGQLEPPWRPWLLRGHPWIALMPLARPGGGVAGCIVLSRILNRSCSSTRGEFLAIPRSVTDAAATRITVAPVVELFTGILVLVRAGFWGTLRKASQLVDRDR